MGRWKKVRTMGKETRARRAAEAAAELAKEDRLALDFAKEEGERDALRRMCDWLEAEFMNNDVEIDSPRGEAIRHLAGELVAKFAPSEDEPK